MFILSSVYDYKVQTVDEVLTAVPQWTDRVL